MAQTTFKQALVSSDADFVKRVRTQYKGRVTRLLNTLQKVLVKIDNQFDHTNIDHSEVVKLVEDLQADQIAVSELHIRYLVQCNHPENSDEEEVLAQNVNAYIGEIEDNIRTGLRLYHTYVVDHKARDEFILNQNKLAKEVEQQDWVALMSQPY